MTDLAAHLSKHALMSLGTCPIDASDALDGQSLVLVGPDEPRFWSVFSQSKEFLDGEINPLDRWSKRVLDSVAQELGATAVYPFGVPPFQPFISWALRSGQAWPSPVGLLVHEKVGLFVSYRGALVLPDACENPGATIRPCETCSGQPCAGACPVGAFQDGYDVAACKAHVRSDAGRDCREGGCLARRACPVGQGARQAMQSAFHMEAFL